MIKKILLLLLCSAILLSCGKHVKNITTSETKDKSVITTVDKSITEIDKTIDTLLHVPGFTLTTGLIVTDTPCTGADSITSNSVVDTPTGTKLTVSYNNKTKQFSAKVEKPPTTFNAQMKVAIKKQNDITITDNKNVATKTKDKQVTRSGTAPNWTLVFIVAIVVIAVLAFLCFIAFKKK